MSFRTKIMIIILVGPPGSGKSTFLKKVSEKGIKVFNTDSFIRDIYKINKPGYEVIKETFGEEYVTKKEVDHGKMRSLVLEDPNNLKILNEKIHPIIKNHLEGKDNYVAELPIVNTSPVKFDYDKMVLITASDQTIIDRLEKRNFKNKPFLKLILKKWNNKINYDYVIDTTNGITAKQVNDFIKKFDLNSKKKKKK